MRWQDHKKKEIQKTLLINYPQWNDDDGDFEKKKKSIWIHVHMSSIWHVNWRIKTSNSDISPVCEDWKATSKLSCFGRNEKEEEEKVMSLVTFL